METRINGDIFEGALKDLNKTVCHQRICRDGTRYVAARSRHHKSTSGVTSIFREGGHYISVAMVTGD